MLLLLITHITVALAGLICSTSAFVAPSRSKITATFALIAATIASGSWLVVSTHTSILHACVSGLVYVGLASSGALAARRKLAREAVRIHIDQK